LSIFYKSLVSLRDCYTNNHLKLGELCTCTQ